MMVARMKGMLRPIATAALAVGLLLGSAVAPAQEAATKEAPAAANTTAIVKPFLWRIEKIPPSYMFGTIHLPDPRTSTMPPVVLEAISHSDEVYTEIEMDLASMMGSAMKFVREDGKKLADVLPPELHRRFVDYVRKKGGNPATLEPMKTWAATLQLATIEYADRMMANPPLDMKVAFEAARLGKKTGGIETIEEQLGVFEAFSEEEQIRLLEITLDGYEELEKSGKNPTEQMVELYANGDLEHLVETMMETTNTEDPLNRRFFKLLNEDRNIKMRDRMMEKMGKAPESSFFFAFGALHFHGEAGLVHLLEEQGYRITRIEDPVGSAK
jgi:uncharacterized protein YbaP (TraB family)